MVLISIFLRHDMMRNFSQNSFNKFVKEYHSFGKKMGQSTLRESIQKLGFQRGFSKILNPVTDWSRFSEFFITYEILLANLTSGDRVLDIGSPKLFSIWLATQMKLNITATDIWDFAANEYSHFWDHVKKKCQSQISFETADALKLHYNVGEFDGLFSISTIEHAYHNDWKNIISKNIAKVLKRNKIAVITTPFGSKNIFQYKDHAEYSPYLAEKNRNFFMRIIDENECNEFIKISNQNGLTLENAYTINKYTNSIGNFIRILPVHLNVLLGFLKPHMAIQSFNVTEGIHYATNEQYDEKWKSNMVTSDIVLLFRKTR